ncbi:MAG: hypothetical protein ABFS86_19355, partial [Planctomycetota bacterium]
ENDVDIVMIPDLDFINLPFLWQFRREGNESFNFDNVTFVLNAVDALIGDESFIALRKRRLRERPLVLIESEEAVYRDQWRKEKESAEAEAQVRVSEAQANLDRKVKEIQDREDLDDRAKEIQMESVRGVEQRRLDTKRAAIEDEKQQRIDEAKGVMNEKVQHIQNNYRIKGVGLSPIPAILVGIIVFFVRRKRERIEVPESRSLTGGEA